MKKTTILGAVAFLFVVVAGCGNYSMRVAEEFSIDAAWAEYERMVVETCNGKISLVNDGVAQIEIRGEKHARARTLEEAQRRLDLMQIVARESEDDPKTFVIKLKTPPDIYGDNLGASFDVRIPAACAAKLRSGNGSIIVHNLKQVALHTSNGQIEAREIAGTLDAETCNGGIRLTNVLGPVDAETSNGRIIAEGIGGPCVLQSSNGDVFARDVDGGVRAQTSNGDVEVQASPGPDGAVIMHTSNGGITAELSADVRGELLVRLSNGRLDVDLGPAGVTDLRQSKHKMQALLNGGGQGRIEAKTTNGSIRLKCR